MAYNKEEIFEKSKEAITKHRLFFIEDIVAYLPCSKPTFYDYFPPNSNELNELKGLLEINRTELKVSMRSKWYRSNSPALQMALMKIIASPEELKRLSMSYHDHATNGKDLPAATTTINYSKLSTETLEELERASKNEEQ